MILSFALCFFCFLVLNTSCSVDFLCLVRFYLEFSKYWPVSWFLGSLCSISERFIVTWYFFYFTTNEPFVLLAFWAALPDMNTPLIVRACPWPAVSSISDGCFPANLRCGCSPLAGRFYPCSISKDAGLLIQWFLSARPSVVQSSHFGSCGVCIVFFISCGCSLVLSHVVVLCPVFTLLPHMDAWEIAH